MPNIACAAAPGSVSKNALGGNPAHLARGRSDVRDFHLRGADASQAPPRTDTTILSPEESRPPFASILNPQGNSSETSEPPTYFGDLNLDQVVLAITNGKQEYQLQPFLYSPLKNIGEIIFRQEVMRDVQSAEVLQVLKAFAADLHLAREKVSQSEKLYYKQQKERWFLNAAQTYCAAVEALHAALSGLALSSAGLCGFRNYLGDYLRSERFGALRKSIATVTKGLDAVRYCVLIGDTKFQVRRYEGEQDYSAEISATFEKFRQGAAKDYKAEFSEMKEMNHIEAKIVEFVSLLFPEAFSALSSFVDRYRAFLDPVIGRFDREVQFYISCVDYVNILRRAGLPFCYPQVSPADKAIYARDVFDIALAAKLVPSNTPVITNEFHLVGSERVFVVSGPNQGGKTTFARTFGQLHYLASLGCPVPGSSAKLFLWDDIFTHFEREEAIGNLHGKLQDDLVRIHTILDRATPHSIIIMNEIFTSTTLQDAIFLGRKVLERIVQLDCLCVCVTFLDELAFVSNTTVSMMSTIVSSDPGQRTFKVLRRPADGRAHAISIAEKYRLTYQAVKARLAKEPEPVGSRP